MLEEEVQREEHNILLEGCSSGKSSEVEEEQIFERDFSMSESSDEKIPYQEFLKTLNASILKKDKPNTKKNFGLKRISIDDFEKIQHIQVFHAII